MNVPERSPTRAQLDAALPRVPAGIPAMCGDLTDPEDRAAALDWLEALYRQAVLQASKAYADRALAILEADETAQDSLQASAGGSEGTGVPRNTQTGTQGLGGCFRCRGVLLDRPCSSCGWFHRALPPPRPGTHESDLCVKSLATGGPRRCLPCLKGLAAGDEYWVASRWSRKNTPDTPTED